MTAKEAIQTIKAAKAEVEWNYPFAYAAAFELAIKALEKQIPKQPKYEDVDNVYGAIKRTCTACGDVCMVSKGAKPYEHYCRQCGQALEWSENNG